MARPSIQKAIERIFKAAATATGGLAIGLGLLGGAEPATLQAAQADRPNIVFIMGDDVGWFNIGGNYYDQVSDTTVPVSGAVDKKDQRAAWRVGANKNLVIETGLYNLTQDQSTALVHFGSDRTQQYVLVRLKQPDERQQQPAAAPPAG